MSTHPKSSSSVRVFYPRFNKAEVIQLIDKYLRSLQNRLPLKLVVLFGSYARGNYTAASDVDLLVVYGGGRRDDAFAITKKTIAIPGLEPHVYTEEEYQRLRDTIDKMIGGAVVLFPSDGTFLPPTIEAAA